MSDQALDVHPTVLDNLGRLNKTQARQWMKGWFTRSEQDALIRMAGCRDPEPLGNTYWKAKRSPFLVYDLKEEK